MNWQFKLLMIATMSVAISCKKKDKDVIELQPSNEVGALFISFNPDTVSTVHLDSTYSNDFRIARHLVGTMNDPLFGSTIASTFGELVLPENNLDLGDTIQYLSVELYLSMDYHYGDDSPLKILVNKVEEDLSDKEEYYTFDNALIGENIGEHTFSPSDENSQLIFPLSNTFGMSLFNQTEDGSFKDQASFRDYINGISLQPQNGNSIVGFDYDSTFVRLNYTSKGDTVFKDFSFRGSYHFNRVISDKTGTLLSNLTSDKSQIISDNSGDQSFLQASTRLNTKLDFTSIKAFLEKRDVAVYRAELEVTASSVSSFDNPDGLFIYSSNNTNAEITNDLLAVNASSNYVLISGGKYTFDITDYLQRVISNLTELEDFMLSVSPNGHRVDQLVINNPKKNIAIKIYYTEL